MTTRELADYFKVQNHKALTTDAVRKLYLAELENNGYIDKEDSELDKRVKIYWPIIETEISEEGESNKCGITTESCNFLPYNKIMLPRNFKNIPQNWLNHVIFELLYYSRTRDQLQFVDANGHKHYCICEFVTEYEKNNSLKLYFKKDANESSRTKIFGDLQLVEE